MILRKRTRLNIVTTLETEAQPSTLEGELLADLQGVAQRGDREKFWLDMKAGLRRAELSVYRKRLLRPSDHTSQNLEIYAASSLTRQQPFILRKADGASHYKLVGEAYIHGLMRGEAVNNIRKDEQQEKFILC